MDQLRDEVREELLKNGLGEGVGIEVQKGTEGLAISDKQEEQDVIEAGSSSQLVVQDQDGIVDESGLGWAGKSAIVYSVEGACL